MDLKKLLDYDRVVIQCHDNPDPDAIASAFALSRFLTQNGKISEIVYSGVAPLQKANLVLMTSSLGIDMRFIPAQSEPPHWEDEGHSLLLVVDGQAGAGNVKNLSAKETAVIDHHPQELPPPALYDIRPFLGSCATLVWLLLREADFDFAGELEVSTALYYGLYTDTGGFSEIRHPLDMDMRDTLRIDAGLFKRLKSSNLTLSDLRIAGRTLTNCHFDPVTHSAIFEADPCDPNILGFASDLALQVDNIDACVVFCRVSGGVKISVRSCVREIMANELADHLCREAGSGGGHKEKAGGFISAEALERLGGLSPAEFLRERFRTYFSGYDLVYSDAAPLDKATCRPYKKIPTPVGYVRTADISPTGAELVVRTLEGDTFVDAGADTYILVGIRQEVYPILRKKFEASYEPLSGPYRPDGRFRREDGYSPTVRAALQETLVDLGPYIRPCIPTGEALIYARELTRRTKVFTAWNLEGYMFGDIGDYLAVRADDPADVYIIERDIFAATYRSV